MPIFSACATYRNEFSESDRTRGDSYFRQGRVSAFNFSDGKATAEVLGASNRKYVVEVELEESLSDLYDYSCSCPQYGNTGCCKHLWAVLRRLDSDLAKAAIGSHAGVNIDKAKSRAVPPTNTVDDVRAKLWNNRSNHDRTMTAVDFIRLPYPGAPPRWKVFFDSINQQIRGVHTGQLIAKAQQCAKTPWFLLNLSVQTGAWPVLKVYLRDKSETDELWYRSPEATHRTLDQNIGKLSPVDAKIIEGLLRVNPDNAYDNFDHRRPWQRLVRNQSSSICSFAVGVDIVSDRASLLLRDIVETGRMFWRVDPTVQPEPMKIETFVAEPFQPQVVFSDIVDDQFSMDLRMQASGAFHPLRDITWAWRSGVVLLVGSLGEVDPLHLPWLAHFMNSGVQQIPSDQRDGLIHSLLKVTEAPPLVWPESWNLVEVTGVPQPVLKLKWPAQLPRNSTGFLLNATVMFRYGEHDLAPDNLTSRLFDADNSRLLTRDRQQEQTQLTQLIETKSLVHDGAGGQAVEFSALSSLTESLSSIGWLVEAEGRPLVAPGHFSLEVTSDMDWFDLSGGVTYADQIVPLPALLQAVRRKENFIRLDDGSHGMLPTEWVERFGKFLELANEEGDTLQFGRAQALILDALLAEQEQTDSIKVDATFKNIRKQLAAFDGIKPGKQPRAFRGELREYQRDGLGWFGFLQAFGFGGCLADDMGLGKTIQILALLEQRRARRLKHDEVRKPSLVVVPKSLVFNWIEEAAKFAPQLKVVDYTGNDRQARVHELATADVILTTYGTLRKDTDQMLALDFDYAILDEAQAIKNPKTDAAKSCYLLKADHRLTMTGTPIENHLGDLWSQFRFLNPGLLGHSQAFAAFSRVDCQAETLEQLSKAIRPFILRRTKQEVLKDLPDKTEQTLFCEMTPKQKRQYNELREHYRVKLGETIQELGMHRSKIHVLEALLRLRQAACDGRLVNPKLGARGAKMDLLLEQLEEVMGEGHKVLVFSQFTSLLALLEKDLKTRKMRYEYLDGKTNDRKSPVHRFQHDANCQLFLISLKAGGHGLNLTAADYVYILDPWWNPAVEAQAIDRAHRMGQTKNVFAYRMITKGTVEEKILELQKTKRELADSIISGNSSLIRTLTADDLQLLLGS